MRKNVLSLLMALCLTLSLAPAAFAADTARELPEDLITISEDDFAAAYTANGGTTVPGIVGDGTQEHPYQIGSAADLEKIQYLFDSYSGEHHIKLTGDIDLNVLSEPAEWGGYLTYFRGSIDGGGHTISGIPDNRYFIYGWVGGTIQNLTLDLKGEAGALLYSGVALSQADGSILRDQWNLSNITVVSSTGAVKLTGNDQANYAPFMFSSSPYLVMEDCVNYANISGNTYASVFYGYYPLPLDDYPTDAFIRIVDCENHGNVSLRYAGLVFGNPSGMGEDRNVTIEGMKNYGEIRGTETAHFFCSDAGNTSLYNDGTYFDTMEKALDPGQENSDMRLTCEDQNCPNQNSTGNLCVGKELDGFAVSVNEDKQFVVTPAKGDNNVETYSVTAYHYVNYYDADGKPQGTDRISITEEVSANGNYTTDSLKDYPLRDGTSIYDWDEFEAVEGQGFLYFCYDEGKYGYWLDNETPNLYGYTHHIVSPGVAGETEWVVYASAYDGNGNLIDTVSLTRNVE